MDRGSRLEGGETLAEGDYLSSPDEKCKFVMQLDGNFVGYEKWANGNGMSPFWSSKTNGHGRGPYKLMMKADGNVAVIDGSESILWSTKTSTPGSCLMALGGHHLKVFSPSDIEEWDNIDVKYTEGYALINSSSIEESERHGGPSSINWEATGGLVCCTGTSTCCFNYSVCCGPLYGIDIQRSPDTRNSDEIIGISVNTEPALFNNCSFCRYFSVILSIVGVLAFPPLPLCMCLGELGDTSAERWSISREYGVTNDGSARFKFSSVRKFPCNTCECCSCYDEGRAVPVTIHNVTQVVANRSSEIVTWRVNHTTHSELCNYYSLDIHHSDGEKYSTPKLFSRYTRGTNDTVLNEMFDIFQLEANNMIAATASKS